MQTEVVYSKETVNRIGNTWNKWFHKHNLNLFISKIVDNRERGVIAVSYTLETMNTYPTSQAPHIVEISEQLLEDASERILEWMIDQWGSKHTTPKPASG